MIDRTGFRSAGVSPALGLEFAFELCSGASHPGAVDVAFEIASRNSQT
jgi:hypothetical protein